MINRDKHTTYFNMEGDNSILYDNNAAMAMSLSSN